MTDRERYESDFWGEGAARARKKTRDPLFLILGLVLLAFFTFGIFACTGYLVANKIFNVEIGQADKNGHAEAAVPGKADTVLLIGVDGRDPKEPSRSDTIILAVLDPKESRVDLLSIPRDTRVKIPKYGYDKINAAHAYGGPELLMNTINELLGTHIDKYVEVDFEGFANIIDILGGIEINVEKRMYYPEEGIDLQAGLQRLNGYDALGYVRYRNDPEGDISRIRRQQKFLQAVVDQTVKLSTLPKIPKLVNEISQQVNTNLGVKDMLTLALGMKNLDSSSITSYTLPGEGRYINGISYWIVDQKELADTLAAIPKLQ